MDAKYSSLIPVAVSCFSHDVYLYVKAGKEFKVNGWQSIPHDYVIGYRKGLQYIERAAKKYEISIYPLVNLDQVLGLIIADKIDVAVGTERLFALNNKVRQKKDIVMLQPAIERHHFYSYLHKKIEIFYRHSIKC